MRKCTKCAEVKADDQYHNAGIKEYPDRLRGECILCNRVRSITEEQREARNKKQKDYYRKPEINSKVKKQRADDRRNNPIKYLLKGAKTRAKRDGMPFNLDERDIIIPKVCPILGIPLVVNQGGTGGPSEYSPSIDKYIPSLGYVKGNICVISNKANTMKNSATLEEVTKLYLWMKQKENKSDST